MPVRHDPNRRTALDDDIQRILSQHPVLNCEGYGWSPFHKTEESRLLARLELSLSADRIRAAQAWIAANLVKRQNINESWGGSYMLKHQCEADTGYLTNGSFIVAMLLEGYQMKVWRNDINPCFGVTMRSARAAWERAKRV
jgi:hypothetical protein